MMDGQGPRARERVGHVLDEKWTLEHLLGTGGMAAVYAARHRNGARAAVKILHPELARIAEVRERFLREGYAANRVEHRGAVQVLDDDVVKAGPDEGSAYIVMELLEGESLQERALRRPKLGERELLEVMDAVLDVLAAAHEHGVIHRDLKPENIFLARDPERDGVRVKVLDFGLARLTETAAVTSAGIAVGTPSFMSPEQAAGRSGEIDGRTDLFALGATIFRIATGRRIHEADNMVRLVALMASVPAPRLRSLLPDVSEGFARVIDRSLAFAREDRYRGAASMRADVQAALELGVRGSTASMHVIPFSTRHVPVAPALVADVGHAAHTDGATAREEDAPAEASGGAGLASPISRGSPARVAMTARERSIAENEIAARSGSTLPWALVLVLLAIGAWRLGPSLQDELVRRASFEPVRRLWSPAVAAPAAADPEPATAPPPSPADPSARYVGEASADEPAPEEPPARDAEPRANDAEPNAGAVTASDAGASRAIAARPRPGTSTAGRPAAKKPPPAQPPRKQAR